MPKGLTGTYLRNGPGLVEKHGVKLLHRKSTDCQLRVALELPLSHKSINSVTVWPCVNHCSPLPLFSNRWRWLGVCTNIH